MQAILRDRQLNNKINIILDLLDEIEALHPELNIIFDNTVVNKYSIQIEKLVCHFTTYKDVIAALNLIGITANIVKENNNEKID